ncbi:MAG: phosphatidylserine decarboxylase family protein [Nitrospirales bacterium]|nr:phosphatidylserine decarboxylase family protein [Nitrospirales bacterium]
MVDRAVGLPLAREGLPFVLGVGIPAAVVGLVGWNGAFAVLGALTCFTAWFFRNPYRKTPLGQDVIIAPADGRIVSIEEEFESRYLKEHSRRISIFLNIFDVHINRMPCAGTIADIAYQPGQFLAADRPEATVRNEQNALMIKRLDNRKVLCVQVAGLIARRIVCWASPGDAVMTGERFGLIRFGSRVDMFLPMDSHIQVSKGSAVKGGETILATLPCADHC